MLGKGPRGGAGDDYNLDQRRQTQRRQTSWQAEPRPAPAQEPDTRSGTTMCAGLRLVLRVYTALPCIYSCCALRSPNWSCVMRIPQRRHKYIRADEAPFSSACIVSQDLFALACFYAATSTN